MRANSGKEETIFSCENSLLRRPHPPKKRRCRTYSVSRAEHASETPPHAQEDSHWPTLESAPEAPWVDTGSIAAPRKCCMLRLDSHRCQGRYKGHYYIQHVRIHFQTTPWRVRVCSSKLGTWGLPSETQGEDEGWKFMSDSIPQ